MDIPTVGISPFPSAFALCFICKTLHFIYANVSTAQYKAQRLSAITSSPHFHFFTSALSFWRMVVKTSKQSGVDIKVASRLQ
jgi:hypothetical protein